ncbi:MAG: multicopper oxidase domain-containing protein [Bacillota bacterium]|nr:MAG: copper oxidase [Bacillota bacterium]
METTRRHFLKVAGLAGAGLATLGLAACATPSKGQNGDAGSGGTSSTDTHSTTTGNAGGMTWQEMDAHHEAGIKAFPAPTEGKGAQPLEPRIENGVKVFELTCKKVQWEVEPGKKVEAWTYNGTVPGPLIRVTEGDRVRVIVKNELDESTAVHWHGVLVENSQDGVPFLTQPPIRPGETYVYEWTAANPGTHMYHSHHNSTKQNGMGLFGPLIIDPKDPGEQNRYNAQKEYLMFLSDGPLGYLLNGKSFPATEPIVAKKGERVRIRMINNGFLYHPMHLHGLTMTVVEKDGYPLPTPFRCDNLSVAPGDRWDVIVEATNPGKWAFHCHVLTHAESEMGMFGLVTVFIVEE